MSHRRLLLFGKCNRWRKCSRTATPQLECRTNHHPPQNYVHPTCSPGNSNFSHVTVALSPCFKNFSFRCLSTTCGAPIEKDDINSALWENEKVVWVNSEKGISCETNSLASNQPSEDQLFIVKSKLRDNCILAGVLDGHGGGTFGRVVKERLPYYLHTAICSKQLYEHRMTSPVEFVDDLLGEPCPQEDESWLDDLKTYMKKLLKDERPGRGYRYISMLRQMIMGNPRPVAQCELDGPYSGIAEIMRTSFLRLDNDITKEIKSLAASGSLTSENIGMALSGCCVVVAYVMDDELFVASCGDCRAVLGTVDNDSWSSVQLTNDHTAMTNTDEVQRILREHPVSESRTCMQYGRLLGRLAPLRAFGDIQFKLTLKELRKIFKTVPNYTPLQGLLTPPYLTAEPEVFHYKLESRDKFVVLASDGLWDMLSNEEVVDVVAAYINKQGPEMMKEKAIMFGVANCDDLIDDPDAFNECAGENVASFLIRFALGGYDEQNLRTMMTLPYPDSRLYRDDITVVVLFLNQEDDGDVNEFQVEPKF